MRKREKIVLILILLAGAAARLYQIKDVFFITDEGYTLKNCSIHMVSLIKYWFSEGHFPTYFIIMHYWMKIFGATVITMRFLSLIFGVLSIYAIFVLGKKLFDEKTGLLAGFILAMNSLNIYYSQCARPYSMLEFFVIMSFLFLYYAVEKNNNLCWAGYVFFTLFTLLLSVSALPVAVCQIALILLLRSRYEKNIDIKKIISVFFLILIAYLPFLFRLSVLSFKDNRIAPLHWLPLPSFKAVLDTFNLFGGTIYIDNYFDVPAQGPLSILVNIFGIILFLLCVKGIFVLFKSGEKKDRIKGMYLSIWLGGPIVLLYVFSQLMSPVFGPVRYVLYISPAYYLLISKGIASFKKKIHLSAVIFIIIFSFIFSGEYHSILYHKNAVSPWKKIPEYLAKNSKINDTIVLSFHNSAGLFDILFNRTEILLFHKPAGLFDILFNRANPSDLSDLSMRGVWSSELLKAAKEEEMAKKIISGKGIPEDKKQDVDSIVKSIGITELQDLDRDQFWYIDWDTDTSLRMAQLFKDRYNLTEENSFDNVKVYWFKKK